MASIRAHPVDCATLSQHQSVSVAASHGLDPVQDARDQSGLVHEGLVVEAQTQLAL